MFLIFFFLELMFGLSFWMNITSFRRKLALSFCRDSIDTDYAFDGLHDCTCLEIQVCYCERGSRIRVCRGVIVLPM